MPDGVPSFPPRITPAYALPSASTLQAWDILQRGRLIKNPKKLRVAACAVISDSLNNPDKMQRAFSALAVAQGAIVRDVFRVGFAEPLGFWSRLWWHIELHFTRGRVLKFSAQLVDHLTAKCPLHPCWAEWAMVRWFITGEPDNVQALVNWASRADPLGENARELLKRERLYHEDLDDVLTAIEGGR